MSHDGGLLGWVMAGVGAIVATLSSAVAILYKAQMSDLKEQLMISRESAKDESVDHKAQIDRLDKVEHELRGEIETCKQDREQLRVSLARIEAKQEIMESRITAVEKIT